MLKRKNNLKKEIDRLYLNVLDVICKFEELLKY